MTQLLVYKEQIQKFYQKFSFVLNPFFRFLAGYIVFFSINRMIGYHPNLNHVYVELLSAVLCTLLPGSVMLFFATAFAVGHIYYVSVILAFVSGIIFATLYFAYIKFVPEHAYIIIAFPILFSLHIVYVLPLLLGLIMPPVALIPIICGVGVYYYLQTITSVISTAADGSSNLYRTVVDQFFNNQELYVLIFVFFVVSFTVYFLQSREWNYVYEKAIVIGTVVNVVLLLTVNFIFDLHMAVQQIFLGSFASMLIVYVIQFMRLVLTYTSVEHLQFEDEEYVYYVRAVPKAAVSAPRKRIKHFSVRKNVEEEASDSKENQKENRQ